MRGWSWARYVIAHLRSTGAEDQRPHHETTAFCERTYMSQQQVTARRILVRMTLQEGDKAGVAVSIPGRLCKAETSWRYSGAYTWFSPLGTA